jgi:hypothetical protein
VTAGSQEGFGNLVHLIESPGPVKVLPGKSLLGFAAAAATGRSLIIAFTTVAVSIIIRENKSSRKGRAVKMTRRLDFRLSMIFSENRSPLFGVML